jgi:hypothetical protein
MARISQLLSKVHILAMHTVFWQTSSHAEEPVWQRPAMVSPKGFVAWDYAWGLLILLIGIALRVHLLGVPLERDEGEYAYAGQLILNGFLPYSNVYNMKMPGIYGAYALVMAIFGQTPSGIHLGLMVANLATLIFLFLLGKYLLDRTTGIIAAVSFAVLSVSQSVQGVFANAEHFVILAAVAGIYLLLRAADSRHPLILFLSGLLFGLAFLLKQHGAAYIAFAVVYLIYQGRHTQPGSLRMVLANILVLLAGAALPFALTCLLFLASGVFDKFWFWTFTYAREYVSMVSPGIGWELFSINFRPIVSSAPLLWMLAGWGLLALFWDQMAREQLFFIGTLVIFSFLAIVPGFYFRPHYFVLVLPAISLLIGVGISAMGRLIARVGRRAAKIIPVAIILLALLSSVYQQRLFLFGVEPAMASRLTYGANHFPEFLKIGQYLREHTTKADTIAVVGSEPEVYFYAHRRAATGYIYTYPLMEPHPYAKRMQEEMIREIEESQPAYLVFVDIRTSWLARPESERLIFDWLRKYAREFYNCVKVIDTIPLDNSSYGWRGALEGSPSIYVYKRKL